MADTANGLRVSLRAINSACDRAENATLVSTFEEVGDQPISLTFWWNRFLRITERDGRFIAAGPGPELPCGVKEMPVQLQAGVRHERSEPLACTQPSGLGKRVGWQYTLKPALYRISLLFANTSAHGYAPNRAPDAWKGRVETASVEITIDPSTR